MCYMLASVGKIFTEPSPQASHYTNLPTTSAVVLGVVHLNAFLKSRCMDNVTLGAVAKSTVDVTQKN